MVKKINEDAVTIKRLLKHGLSQKKISMLLGIKKQKVKNEKIALIEWISCGVIFLLSHNTNIWKYIL